MSYGDEMVKNNKDNTDKDNVFGIASMSGCISGVKDMRKDIERPKYRERFVLIQDDLELIEVVGITPILQGSGSNRRTYPLIHYKIVDSNVRNAVEISHFWKCYRRVREAG